MLVRRTKAIDNITLHYHLLWTLDLKSSAKQQNSRSRLDSTNMVAQDQIVLKSPSPSPGSKVFTPGPRTGNSTTPISKKSQRQIVFGNIDGEDSLSQQRAIRAPTVQRGLGTPGREKVCQ